MSEEDNESQTTKTIEQLVKQDNLIEIDDKKRNIIFLCLTAIAIFSSCDGGIVPQQNTFIQEDFGEKEEQRVGLFGSIDYSGRVVGALIFTVIMGKMNRKLLLVSTLLFKSLTLFVPLFTINYYINSIARGLSGLSQVFYPTYLPVWCDQYGKKNKKTIWVMIVQIGNPLGIIIGYGLGLLFEKLELFGMNGWRTSFAIEGVILILCAVIIFFFEDMYFSEKFLLVEDSKGKEEIKDEQKKVTLFANIGSIICNKIFLFSSLCNSVAFFGIGVVQFYGDKYMKLVLDIGDSIRFILFGLLCLFGPTSGMVFGGIISSKLGGYVKRSSMMFIIIAMIVAGVISMLIACHEISVLFIITSWTYLFAIGTVIPPLSGIIISCLDNNLRGDGFSLCNFLNNLLGNFPSSYAFSILVDVFDQGDNNSDKYRYAWMITMGYNFIGLLFVIIAGVFRLKIKGDLSDGKEENNINSVDGETKSDDNTE